MRIVIVDDEYLAQEGLKMELAQFPEIEVVGQFSSVRDFLEQYEHLSPDLLFVDIEMPEMNGFDLIEALRKNCTVHLPEIVFVTAYANYAIEAFETHVTDYLLKPVTATRLKKTLARTIPIDRGKLETGHKEITGSGDMPASLSADSARSNLDRTHEKGGLMLHCFGPFRLSLGGQSLDLKWRSKKELELLAYLACQRGNAVSKERVADALWPDLDSKRASANLYLTYHYLHASFKRAQINLPVISVRTLMRIDVDQCSIDLLEFDRLIEIIRKSQSQAKITAMEEVCTRFSQPLLDTISNEWGISLKYSTDYLLEKYRLELARWYENADPSKSAYFYSELSTEK